MKDSEIVERVILETDVSSRKYVERLWTSFYRAITLAREDERKKFEKQFCIPYDKANENNALLLRLGNEQERNRILGLIDEQFPEMIRDVNLVCEQFDEGKQIEPHIRDTIGITHEELKKSIGDNSGAHADAVRHKRDGEGE
jgi:hypothetical protein